MRSLLVFALIVAVFYLGAVLTLQRRLIYPRVGAPPQIPRVAGLEHWRLGESEQVDAFYLPATGREASGSRPAIVFAHGNGELIDMWASTFEPARENGYAVLLVEYPGYGRSGGSPSESEIARVFEEAYDRLVARDEIDASWIIGYGRSLGGGAIGNLMRARELAAVIFESTFTSTLPLAASLFVPGPLVLDRYDNLSALRKFSGPVLILHGERDPMIPPDHARELAAASPRSQLHLLPCGHNDCPRRWDLVGPFLDEVVLNKEESQ